MGKIGITYFFMAGLNLGKLFKVPRMPKMGGIKPPAPPKVPKPPKPPKSPQARRSLGKPELNAWDFTPKNVKMYASRADLQKATQAQSRASQGLLTTRKMPTQTYATRGAARRAAKPAFKMPKMPQWGRRPSYGFSAEHQLATFALIPSRSYI